MNLFTGLFSGGKSNNSETDTAAAGYTVRNASYNQSGGNAASRGESNTPTDGASTEPPAKPLEPIVIERMNVSASREEAIKTLARLDVWQAESNNLIKRTNEQRASYLSAWNGDGDSRLQQVGFESVRRTKAIERLGELRALENTQVTASLPSADELVRAQFAMSMQANGARVTDPSISADNIFEQRSDGINIRTFGGGYRLEKLPESGRGQEYRVTVYDQLPDANKILAGERVAVRFEPQTAILTQEQLAAVRTDNKGLMARIGAELDPEGTRLAREEENRRRSQEDQARRETNRQRYRQEQRDRSAWQIEQTEMLIKQRDAYNRLQEQDARSAETSRRIRDSSRADAGSSNGSGRYAMNDVGDGALINSGVNFGNSGGQRTV
jgi:hypothetical protein